MGDSSDYEDSGQPAHLRVGGPIISRMHSLCMAVQTEQDSQGSSEEPIVHPGAPVVRRMCIRVFVRIYALARLYVNACMRLHLEASRLHLRHLPHNKPLASGHGPKAWHQLVDGKRTCTRVAVYVVCHRPRIGAMDIDERAPNAPPIFTRGCSLLQHECKQLATPAVHIRGCARNSNRCGFLGHFCRCEDSL